MSSIPPTRPIRLSQQRRNRKPPGPSTEPLWKCVRSHEHRRSDSRISRRLSGGAHSRTYAKLVGRVQYGSGHQHRRVVRLHNLWKCRSDYLGWANLNQTRRMIVDDGRLSEFFNNCLFIDMVNKIRDSFLAAIEIDQNCALVEATRLGRTKFVSMNNFQNKSFKTVSWTYVYWFLFYCKD